MAEGARLGWVIVYVPDVERALDLYERAFGLRRAFIDPSGRFGQLDTGQTALAFAQEGLASSNLPGGFQRPAADAPPFNVELALVFDDVPAAYERALAAGCTALAPPEPKPHGQVVGYVRDPFGTLVEVCSPVG
jgi:predicted enzyme related to lactoylglutathione lyase